MEYNKNLIERHYRNFQAMLEKKSIAEYFQIKPLSGSLEFTMRKLIHGRFMFIVKSKRISNIDFHCLPVEINNIINSYLDDFILLEFRVDLRNNYPFQPPIWKLVNIQESYGKRLHIDLIKYYKFIVRLHNKMYRNKNWSPGLQLKGDIAKFICRIHHFEVFDDY